MKYIIVCLSIFSLLLIGAMDVHAKGSVKVGGTIPHNLELKDASGNMQSFSKLSGKKGMVLVFVRSVSWCPYCQKELVELNNNVKKFSDLGYSVVSVSYDTQEQMKKFVTKNNPKITLLSDPRSESIKAFGILNQETAKGTMSYGIPYPGTYIIDNKKKVQAKFFKEGYKDRTTVNDLIAKIKKLNPAPKPVYVAPPMTMELMGQDEIMAEDAMIETPDKIMDPIIIPDDFDAANDAVLEEVLKPESVTPEPLSVDTPAEKTVTMPEPVYVAPNDLAPAEPTRLEAPSVEGAL